jgi:hypothetical protein
VGLRLTSAEAGSKISFPVSQSSDTPHTDEYTPVHIHEEFPNDDTVYNSYIHPSHDEYHQALLYRPRGSQTSAQDAYFADLAVFLLKSGNYSSSRWRLKTTVILVPQ